MTGDGLFHIDPDGRLASMRVTPYAAEDLLQQLLADHPDLLAGGQMNPDEPRRWALVQREHGVPDHDSNGGSGGGRWSLDHLFVDQDAVPTLVEVKRSTDTRIRREVVGQMLDYAANGVRYWPVESLRVAFEGTQEAASRTPLRVVHDLTGEPDLTVEGFFERVADHLRAGRIRMVFVADVIPDELRRIVEFLNEQMGPAEVYAVEVKQYLADDYPGAVIVPAVYGRTAAASRKTSGRKADPAEVRANADPAVLAVVDKVTDLAARVGAQVHQTPATVQLRTGTADASPGEGDARLGITIAQVYLSYGTIDISLDAVAKRGWETDAARLHETLRSITSKAITPRYPAVPAVDAVAHWDTVASVLAEMNGYLTAIVDPLPPDDPAAP